MSCVRTSPVPDTGNLRDDLRAMMSPTDLALMDANLQRVYPQMIAAARVNPEVADAYREFISQRRAPMRAVLQRAVSRGEISPDEDLDVVHDLLLAPLLYRWPVSEAPIDVAVVDRIIDVVTLGVRTGLTTGLTTR